MSVDKKWEYKHIYDYEFLSDEMYAIVPEAIYEQVMDRVVQECSLIQCGPYGDYSFETHGHIYSTIQGRDSKGKNIPYCSVLINLYKRVGKKCMYTNDIVIEMHRYDGCAVVGVTLIARLLYVISLTNERLCPGQDCVIVTGSPMCTTEIFNYYISRCVNLTRWYRLKDWSELVMMFRMFAVPVHGCIYE